MIYLNNVSYTYDRSSLNNVPSPQVIKEITLEIKKGEYIAIIGENGSGKSTLVKLINGLILPTSGIIVIDRLDPTNPEQIWKIRERVGMVFQNPENQIVATTVLDDIAFGLENIGLPTSEIITRAKEALAKVNLEGYEDVEPHQLSGGQKQRLAIAGILAMRPEAIIFDEATAMLDPQGKQSILAIMRELHQQGLTIITISHDMNEAIEAERIILLHQGQLVKDNATIQFLQDQNIYEEFDIEEPFVMKLKKGLQKNSIEIPSTIINEKEMVEYLWKLG